MKKTLRVAALTVGLMSLVWWMGREEEQANAEDIPTFPTSPPALGNAAADSKPAQARSVEPDAPPATTPAAAAVAADNNAPTKPGSDALADPVMPPTLNSSPALAEVIKLMQAGVSEDVLMAYITNSADVFNIGSNEILYLHDLGAPSPVITAIIQHDSSPELAGRKQGSNAVKPLPPGVALHAPATNIYPSNTPTQPVSNPPEPVPVNPPSSSQETDASADPSAGYAAPLVEQPVNVSYFYTELAPYGAWIEMPGYGRCWRPTVAVWNSSWRPYGDGGRWLWTDCGWYWYSDYSWGWAPFHYGRWTCPVGLGWVWVPDTCWGPAWVSWRHSASYCGWAPLPPSARFSAGHGFYHHTVSVGVNFDFGLTASDYVFVPTSRFCDRRPYNYYLAPSHATAVFKGSTVVNDYVTVNKTTVINQGVGFQRIASATRGNIRQVALKGASQVRNTNPRREILDGEGRTLTVVRPPAPSPVIAPPGRPVSATSHLRPRTSPVDASGPAGGGLTPSQPLSAHNAVARVEAPSAAPARSGLIGANAQPVRLVRPVTPGVPTVAGGDPASYEPVRKTATPPNAAPASVNLRTPPRGIPLSAARRDREEAPAIAGLGSRDPLEPPAGTRSSREPVTQGTPIVRVPEPIPPRINQPTPIPATPSPPVPASHPPMPASPRVESYRSPSAAPPPSLSAPAPSHSAPAPSHSAPAPSRSESGGRATR